MPKLLDQVREIIRMKHYSIRTEQAYVDWIKRYIFFHNKRHPLEMGEEEFRAFVSDLASNKSVAASTQTVALSALLFLYRDVLKKDLPYVEGIERAKKPKRLPVVFTQTQQKTGSGSMFSRSHRSRAIHAAANFGGITFLKTACNGP